MPSQNCKLEHDFPPNDGQEESPKDEGTAERSQAKIINVTIAPLFIFYSQHPFKYGLQVKMLFSDIADFRFKSLAA